jgi:simple sugar transport system permease protein
MATNVAQARAASPSGFTLWIRHNALQIGISLVAVVMWIIFAIGAPETFFSGNIYQAFMSTTPFFAIMALPLTLVVITGEIDLSFPSIMSLGMLVFSLVFLSTGMIWVAFVLCLLTGLLAGVFNGWLIVRFAVPSLVVTIGTQFFWRGVVQVTLGGNSKTLTDTKDTLLYDLLAGRFLGIIPMQMIWAILIAVAVWYLLNRHRIGAHVYLIGDNQESSRLMGINVAQRKMIVFGLTGLAAAFAGLMQSLWVRTYWPTLGEGYLMSTLSSVFLGGTSVFGGTGTIYGTFVASFIIGAINAGVVAMNISGFWTQLIYGLIVVVAVVVQTIVGKKLG